MSQNTNKIPNLPESDYQIIWLDILEFFKNKADVNDSDAFLLTQLEWLLWYKHDPLVKRFKAYETEPTKYPNFNVDTWNHIHITYTDISREAFLNSPKNTNKIKGLTDKLIKYNIADKTKATTIKKRGSKLSYTYNAAWRKKQNVAKKGSLFIELDMKTFIACYLLEKNFKTAKYLTLYAAYVLIRHDRQQFGINAEQRKGTKLSVKQINNRRYFRATRDELIKYAFCGTLKRKETISTLTNKATKHGMTGSKKGVKRNAKDTINKTAFKPKWLEQQKIVKLLEDHQKNIELLDTEDAAQNDNNINHTQNIDSQINTEDAARNDNHVEFNKKPSQSFVNQLISKLRGTFGVEESTIQQVLLLSKRATDIPLLQSKCATSPVSDYQNVPSYSIRKNKLETFLSLLKTVPSETGESKINQKKEKGMNPLTPSFPFDLEKVAALLSPKSENNFPIDQHIQSARRFEEINDTWMKAGITIDVYRYLSMMVFIYFDFDMFFKLMIEKQNENNDLLKKTLGTKINAINNDAVNGVLESMRKWYKSNLKKYPNEIHNSTTSILIGEFSFNNYFEQGKFLPDSYKSKNIVDVFSQKYQQDNGFILFADYLKEKGKILDKEKFQKIMSTEITDLVRKYVIPNFSYVFDSDV